MKVLRVMAHIHSFRSSYHILSVIADFNINVALFGEKSCARQLVFNFYQCDTREHRQLLYIARQQTRAQGNGNNNSSNGGNNTTKHLWKRKTEAERARERECKRDSETWRNAKRGDWTSYITKLLHAFTIHYTVARCCYCCCCCWCFFLLCFLSQSEMDLIIFPPRISHWPSFDEHKQSNQITLYRV